MFLWIFPVVILSIIGCFAGLWMWTMYLETAKDQQTRRLLFLCLVVCQLLEFFVWRGGILKNHTIYFICFCNLWGMFDAILRYPIVHDIDSVFSIKLILLVAGKTMVYALGFKNMGKNAITFLACLFGCVWSVPLLYVMALPIGDNRAGYAKRDVRDMDIMVKIYLLIRGNTHDANELRQEVSDATRYYRDQVVVGLAKIPGLTPLLVKGNMLDKRAMRKVTREI